MRMGGLLVGGARPSFSLRGRAGSPSGDLGTSPLYVFSSTFADQGPPAPSDVLGALSLIIYTLSFIPLFKYILIILRANDNGNVLSAVDGIRGKFSSLGTNAVVLISIAILIVLFSVQKYGTDEVGSIFAPCVLVWFAAIGCLGVYNIGTEAMFADLGHFSVPSVQLFYRYIPPPVYWPMFVVAVLDAIIASQATMSATFSIVDQSLALGCFPRVKVVHTSSKYIGQVYIITSVF